MLKSLNNTLQRQRKLWYSFINSMRVKPYPFLSPLHSAKLLVGEQNLISTCPHALICLFRVVKPHPIHAKRPNLSTCNILTLADHKRRQNNTCRPGARMILLKHQRHAPISSWMFSNLNEDITIKNESFFRKRLSMHQITLRQ